MQGPERLLSVFHAQPATALGTFSFKSPYVLNPLEVVFM